MIKINLLPAHILEQRRLRSVIVLVAVVILIEAAILGLVMMQYKRMLADEKVELEYWKGRAAQVGQIEGATQITQAETQLYARWPQWQANIDNYHEAWADTLTQIARWIYARVQVNSLSPSPSQVQIVGATESLTTFRTAYLNLLRCPLYTNVTFGISGISGGYTQPSGGGAPGAPAGGAPGAGGMRLAFGLSGGEESAGPAPAAPVAAAQQTNRLPVGVTFTCVLKPEEGGKLNPPGPPLGAGPAAAGAPAAPGGRPGAAFAIPGFSQ